MIYFVVAAIALVAFAVVNFQSNSASTDSSGGIPSPPNAVVGAIANAIATAEGYFSGSGAVPFDQNNPGDLTDYADLYGANSNGITIFPTLAAGWNALYEKIENILSGNSATYSADSSIADIGSTWANDAGEWASNVAASLGISTDTTLGEYSTANSTDAGN
jgi:hypothetical protein